MNHNNEDQKKAGQTGSEKESAPSAEGALDTTAKKDQTEDSTLEA